MAGDLSLSKSRISPPRIQVFRFGILVILRWMLAPLLGLALLGLWIALVEAERYPRFILPHPADVLKRLIELNERGILTDHIIATLREAVTGLAVAIALALPLGYMVARNRWVSALLMPYLVAIRAIPVVAIAAIIVIWLGSGIESKVFVAAFITWFPLMEASVLGMQSIDSQLRDLMRLHQASRWQIFRKLELPGAMPNLIGGLKISATLSVVGAAVGELIGSNRGLAYLIQFGRGTSDAPMVFGAVLLLTLMSLTFYGIAALMERYLLAWRDASR
ncbi:MAG TPA: ABC transporter permease [Aggregatilineales bacterium]|nr:ABC transporter permease [Aggregatilineales bacterium]